MRNGKKKEIREVLETLRRGVAAAEQLAAAERLEELSGLLTECQDTAIRIGQAVEALEGEGTRMVELLEELCEQLYACFVSGSRSGRRKICRAMRRQLTDIVQELSYGIPEDKKLAVFLPYKASMWDSMESVWLAAREDGDWESIVMPVPYVTRGRDGSAERICCEGEAFPEYVPVRSWKDCSLRELRPELIVIHNPYDEYNLVTSVFPEFYAERLRRYTEKLVYIPYFVHQREKVHRQYCVLPGTVYADVVVLQSEKVREQYLRYFREERPDLVRQLGEKALEERFAAWGSPKFDSGKAAEPPKDWEPFLTGRNAGKRVIFFNTHLSGLMEYRSERFLKKLSQVFACFRDREDALLLWRPHPLTLETARAMNPEAEGPYLELVRRYREEGIGIYDDTPQLHRAVQLSDAYYGDYSSVTELFYRQGKPVLIMDDGVTEP